MNSISLRTLQCCMLDLIDEFKRICDKNNINYFLIGGTLLGAVRHKGFIPWDDDIDVGMLRSDYDKFLSVASKELNDKFFLQNYKTDSCYAFGFSKIRINGTTLLEDYAENSKQHNGIFLDIFPYDNMPDKRICQKIHYWSFKMFKWAALGKTDYEFKERKKKRFSILMSRLLFFYSKEKCLEILDRICRKYNNTETENVINLFGAYNYNEFIDKKSVCEFDELVFEDCILKVPSNYDRLLRRMYGDYMQLPPIEKRGNQHSMIRIEMGEFRPTRNKIESICGEIRIGDR